MTTNETYIYRPTAYREAVDISARVRSGDTVILDIGTTSNEEGRKIMDFVSGTTYAKEGYMSKINDKVFVFSKNNIYED